jgi:hypothetical protein
MRVQKAFIRFVGLGAHFGRRSVTTTRCTAAICAEAATRWRGEGVKTTQCGRGLPRTASTLHTTCEIHDLLLELPDGQIGTAQAIAEFARKRRDKLDCDKWIEFAQIRERLRA